MVRQSKVAGGRQHHHDAKRLLVRSVALWQDESREDDPCAEGDDEAHEQGAVRADGRMQQSLLGARRGRVLMRSGFHGLLAVAWLGGRFALRRFAASRSMPARRPAHRQGVLPLLERDRTVAEAAQEPPQAPAGEPDPPAARRFGQKPRTAQHQRHEPQQARQRRQPRHAARPVPRVDVHVVAPVAGRLPEGAGEASPGTARGRPLRERRRGGGRRVAGASRSRCPPARRTLRRSRRAPRRPDA